MSSTGNIIKVRDQFQLRDATFTYITKEALFDMRYEILW